MTRRIVVALTAVAALSLAACGGGGSTPPAASSNPADNAGKKVTLWIMEGTNKNSKPFFDELGAAFTKQTGATLDVQFQQWGSAHDKFVTSIAGNTTPDVAEIGTTWTPEFGSIGALKDIKPDVEKAGLSNGLVKALQEAGSLDNALYGMPWYAGVRSVVYRADIFQELGIAAPTTWDEMVAAATKIKAAKPNMLPFPIAGDQEFAVYPFIWSAGGQIATETGGKWTSAIDSPESRKGIQFYSDLAVKNGFSTPAAATWRETDLRDAFTKGQSAMMIAGSWTPKAILEAAPDLKGKIGAFALPGQTGGLAPSVLGGSLLSVFEGTKNPELSWELVKLMTTGDFAQKWASDSSYFPGTTALMQTATASSDPLVAPFAKQMVDAGRNVPGTPLFGKIQGKKTIAAMMRSILTGEKTVEKATTDAAAEMNQIFAGS